MSHRARVDRHEIVDLGLLATRFEEKRAHLRDVAYRMLGSIGDADDAVQETWLRLTRSDRADVENLGAWLTTVTARVCLDVLRSRKVRRSAPPPRATRDDAADPTRELVLAESVGAALLVVLETLSPSERVAFVLHDMFGVEFEEIGRILGRSEAATRQLASRARRRVRRTDTPTTGRASRQVVDAFLTAARNGNLDALLAVLDPDVVMRADATAVQTAAETKWNNVLEPEVRGAHAVAALVNRRAGGATPATIDGEAGAAWAPRGHVRAVFVFTVSDDTIRAIDLIMDAEALGELVVELTTSSVSPPPDESRR